MNIPQTYHTARLSWRPLQLSDTAAIYRQFSDADMCRYFSEPPCTYAEAQDIITHYRKQTGRAMRWALINAETQQFVGTCGFHYLDTIQRQVEIGYDIWKDYWGQAYMREVLPALMSICGDALPVDIIYALIDRDNRASLAVATRAGFMEAPALRPLDTPTELCLVYRITRPSVAG